MDLGIHQKESDDSIIMFQHTTHDVIDLMNPFVG